MTHEKNFVTVYGVFRISWSDTRILLATKRDLELHKADEILHEVVTCNDEFRGRKVENVRMAMQHRYVGDLE